MCTLLTDLDGWDRVSLLVTQRTDLQIELPLKVTCQVNSPNLESNKWKARKTQMRCAVCIFLMNYRHSFADFVQQLLQTKKTGRLHFFILQYFP